MEATDGLNSELGQAGSMEPSAPHTLPRGCLDSIDPLASPLCTPFIATAPRALRPLNEEHSRLSP